MNLDREITFLTLSLLGRPSRIPERRCVTHRGSRLTFDTLADRTMLGRGGGGGAVRDGAAAPHQNPAHVVGPAASVHSRREPAPY